MYKKVFLLTSLFSLTSLFAMEYAGAVVSKEDNEIASGERFQDVMKQAILLEAKGVTVVDGDLRFVSKEEYQKGREIGKTFKESNINIDKDAIVYCFSDQQSDRLKRLEELERKLTEIETKKSIDDPLEKLDQLESKLAKITAKYEANAKSSREKYTKMKYQVANAVEQLQDDVIHEVVRLDNQDQQLQTQLDNITTSVASVKNEVGSESNKTHQQMSLQKKELTDLFKRDVVFRMPLLGDITKKDIFFTAVAAAMTGLIYKKITKQISDQRRVLQILGAHQAGSYLNSSHRERFADAVASVFSSINDNGDVVGKLSNFVTQK